MLQSRVISDVSCTFVLSVSLWFVSIERDFKGFIFQVSYLNLRQLAVRSLAVASQPSRQS